MAEAKITLTAVDRTAGAFSSIRASLSGVGAQAAAVTAALTGLGATGALAGLVALVRQSTNAIDAFNDLSDATGASIESISALDRVARQSGASFETVAGVLTKFNKVLLDAGEEGSKAASVLKALGLNVQELKRIDPAEALRQTAVALSRFEADGEKARAVQILFGKSVQEAAPLLKNLAEQTALVGKTSAEAAAQAEEFNKRLSAMKADAEDLARALASRVIPVINQFLRDIGTFSQKASLAGLASDLIKAEKELKALEARRGSRFNFAGNLNEEIAAATQRIEAAKAAFRAADTEGQRRREDRGFTPPAASLVLPPEPAKPGPVRTGSSVDANAQSLASYIGGLQSAVDKTRELSEVERARQFLASLGRTGEIEQVQQLVLGLAGQIDAEKEAKLVLQDKRAAAMAAGDAVTKANEEYQALLSSLLDNTPTAQLEKQRKAMQALAEEYEAGRISAQQFNEAASKYLGLDQSAGGQTEAQKRSDALAESIEDGILKGFREGQSLADIFLSELKAQFARTILRPIIQPIAVAGNALITASLDGIAASLGLNSFDVGTDYVPRDQIALIHKGERIVPAAENMRGGGQAVTVIQNFTVGDVASVAMVREAVTGSERRIAAGLGRSLRYGGALA